MARLLFIFLPLLILTACSEKKQNVDLQKKLRKDTGTNSQQIMFAEPQTMDSSHIVIYPLILERENYGGGYSSGSGGQRASYWNLVFYNTETQNQNLLTTDKRVLISSINFSPSSSYDPDDLWTNTISAFKNNIIYTVVANDYNENKQFDRKDPTYLFVSDRNGTNFRQISPDNYNIDSWEVVKGTTKIIMQGQKDNNGDKEFDDNDAIIPLVVDISSGVPAVETFRQNFIDSLKTRLVTIWKN